MAILDKIRDAPEAMVKVKSPHVGRLKYRKPHSEKPMVVKLRSPKDEIKKEIKHERSWLNSDVGYF